MKNTLRFFHNVFLFSVMILILTACTKSAFSDLVQVNSLWTPANEHRHRVKPGETLTRIAKRYGTAYQELARLNHLKPPYRLHVGQRLWLTESSLPHAVPTPKTIVKTKRKKILREKTLTHLKSSHAFQWPLVGKLISKYSLHKGRNGIDLKGGKGDAIRAASGGVVVFSRTGLRGYGNLIIIKHDETFLTAYGHVGKIFVKEHEKVKVGEKIAEIGNEGGREALLHFEIRKKGLPVDPLSYLAKTPKIT